MLAKEKREFDQKRFDQTVPHIAGNLGYPPRYVPSAEEELEMTRAKAAFIKRELKT